MPNSNYLMVDVVIETIDYSTNPPSATYSGSSTPGGNNPNTPVVTSGGEINLNNINKGNLPSRALISFTLSPALTTTVFTDIDLTKSDGGPAGPELAKAVTKGQLVILDLDTDGATYNYCIKVSREGMSATSLDPKLVNRG